MGLLLPIEFLDCLSMATVVCRNFVVGVAALVVASTCSDPFHMQNISMNISIGSLHLGKGRNDRRKGS